MVIKRRLLVWYIATYKLLSELPRISYVMPMRTVVKPRTRPWQSRDRQPMHFWPAPAV